MPENEVSRQVLELSPGRTLTFLRGIGTDLAIRALMAQAGYTEADHTQGWALMHKASGYSPTKPTVSFVDTKVRDAIAKVDDWDEQGFARCSAALTRLFPEQAAFVFDGLQASKGAAAVIGVATFLGRIDALEKGRSDTTRTKDQEAVALLEKRGITKVVRADLAESIRIAQRAEPTTLPTTPSDTEMSRVADLQALHAWYSDWAQTARAVIKRRDHLIRLGLAKRRQSKAEDPGPDNGNTEDDGS